MLRAMSSSDTPLGTAALLEDKLKKEKQAFIVLSGTNKSGSRLAYLYCYHCYSFLLYLFALLKLTQFSKTGVCFLIAAALRLSSK